MAFLAGSCWKGTFAGRTVTDEHCFTWMYDGKFLRDRHEVVGDEHPYRGETTYAWDPQNGRITYWYLGLPGFFSEGHVEVAGDTLIFRDNLVTSAERREVRAVWRRTGPDSYSVRSVEVTGGVEREMWAMEMRRTRRAQ